MTDNVHAILQARMSSSRLPGKVLAEVSGRPMILHQIERINRATLLDRLTVATSTDSSDDLLCQVLEAEGVDYFRGSLDNVADRFVQIIRRDSPLNVVRLTADCPLADWEIIDSTVQAHLSSGADYTSNTLERTFPKGLDVEVFKASSFVDLIAGGVSAQEQEHVTLGFLRKNSKSSLHSVTQDLSFAELRWTVDYQSDLDYVRYVYAQLGGTKENFGFSEILSLEIPSAPDV